MYLKTLTLHGFKSFAHPVTVEFVPGLNVVVGPNGSGKSNLIDALRWVLGERRDVRGGRQILFHGSAKYRPLGMASVELLFEGDKVSPFRIEKRTFASGDTEYFFQGVKVRAGELHKKLSDLGFPSTRLEVSFIASRDLHIITDFRPLERLRWLEETSGVLEMRTRLATLSGELREIAGKRERFRERLKELAFQKERIAEWAKKEEAYQERERQYYGARRAYLEKLLHRYQQELVNLGLRQSQCDRELDRITSCKRALSLEEEEQRFLAFREENSRFRWEIERERQNIEEKERELYRLLTQIRGQRETLLVLEMQGNELLRRIRFLEEKKSFLDVVSPTTFERLGETERILTLFLEKERRNLKDLREQELLLRKELIHLDATLESMEREKRRCSARSEDIMKELAQFQDFLLRKEREVADLLEERNKLEGRKQETLGELSRVQRILERVQKKCEQVEGKNALERFVEEAGTRLLESGWPRRAVHALFGFLQNVQVLENQEVPEMQRERWITRCVFLPPWSPGWRVRKKREILQNFLTNQEPVENLVALDGSCIFLKGGFLLFPQKLVPRACFLTSWKRRELSLRRRAENLKKVLAEISRDEERLEERKREAELCIVRWKERLQQREETQREIRETLCHLDEEVARLGKRRQEVAMELAGLEGKVRGIEEVLARTERSLRKVWEKRAEEEEKRRRWEQFLWEAQRVREEATELVSKIREGEKILGSLRRKLGEIVEELGSALVHFQVRRELLRERDAREKSWEQEIEKRRGEERVLDRQEEKWLREQERLRFEERKVLEDIERIAEDLEALKDIPSIGFETMDLVELQEFLEREKRMLSSEHVRRGAIEEYQELRVREEELRLKDTFLGDLLELVLGELEKLEREVHRTFLSFLHKAGDAFERYFQRVFQNGEASLVVQDGVHLEVQIPGKKRQGLALLSSGERTLVALCFLCACFEAGHSKMCFFDEIDANLDHTNSVLLAQVLREFASSRQVVVVTHKEEVMEVADSIIGVTMNEPGISQVVICEGLSSYRSLQEFSLGGER